METKKVCAFALAPRARVFLPRGQGATPQFAESWVRALAFAQRPCVFLPRGQGATCPRTGLCVRVLVLAQRACVLLPNAKARLVPGKETSHQHHSNVTDLKKEKYAQKTHWS